MAQMNLMLISVSFNGIMSGLEGRSRLFSLCGFVFWGGPWVADKISCQIMNMSLLLCFLFAFTLQETI
jgi:hypothetical protein